jgi:hypothetical protein
MPTSVFYSLSSFCQYLSRSVLRSVSLFPLLLSTVCPHSVSTSHANVLFSVPLYPQLLLDFVYSLPVPHTVSSVNSGSLFPLISTVCSLSVSTFHVPSFVL